MESRIRREVYVRFGRRLPETYWRKPARRRVPTSYLCQANTSFVILDPKGELVRDTGHLLEEKGYEVRVLDLLNMERSHCYNPFVYLRNENDVKLLVTNLF